MLLDNSTIVILTKVNELAQRYELKPYDFAAVIDNHSTHDCMILRYEEPALSSPSVVHRFHCMSADLKVRSPSYELKGSPKQIIETLDSALNHAPKLPPQSRPR
jgi:hypothetical protein